MLLVDNNWFSLYELSDYVSWCIRILLNRDCLGEEWKIISDDTFQILMKLKNVRNILAHSWDFDNAVYGKNKTLEI